MNEGQIKMIVSALVSIIDTLNSLVTALLSQCSAGTSRETVEQAAEIVGEKIAAAAQGLKEEHKSVLEDVTWKPAPGTWDPTREEKQGSYRTKDKKEAIDAAIQRLGIDVNKSATYAKKHQAILDHVKQFGAGSAAPMQEEKEPDGGACKSWDEFSRQIMINVQNIGRDNVLDVVEKYEGHRVVAESHIQVENYQKILDATYVELWEGGRLDPKNAGANDNLIEEAPNKTGELGSIPLPDGPVSVGNAQSIFSGASEAGNTPQQNTGQKASGVDSIQTKEQLISWVQQLVANGTNPQIILGAVSSISASVHAVPDDKIQQAVSCIRLAVGV